MKTPVRGNTKTGTTPFDIQHLHPSIGAATTGATLTRATLIEAAQTKANLSCAILLNGTALTGATLTAAAITGAILTGTTMTGVYPNRIWPANQIPLNGGCQPGATQIKPTGGSLTEACKKCSSLGGSIKVCSSWVAQVRHASVRVALTWQTRASEDNSCHGGYRQKDHSHGSSSQCGSSKTSSSQ